MKKVKIQTPVIKFDLYKLLDKLFEEAVEAVWADVATVRAFENVDPAPEPPSGPAWDEWCKKDDALEERAGEATAAAFLANLGQITNYYDLPQGAQKRVHEELVGQCTYAWRRAHKHTERPSVDQVRESMDMNVCLFDIFEGTV